MQRNRIERTASKRWRGTLRRMLAVSLYSMSCLSHGCSTGWVSAALGRGALTKGSANSWLAALPSLVAVVAGPMAGVLATAKGRKVGAFCIAVCFIISWGVLAWGNGHGRLAARALAGAGGAGAAALAPLYCAELCRAKATALPALAFSCGVLLAFTAGPWLSEQMLSTMMLAPAAILLLSLAWLPETPPYLISVGRIQDAARVMCWFEGSDFRTDMTDVVEEQEVRLRTSGSAAMRRRLSDTFQPMLQRTSGLDSSEGKRDESACRALFRHRGAWRALFGCGITVSAGGATASVLSYTTSLLDKLQKRCHGGSYPSSQLTPEGGAVVSALGLLLGALVAAALVDRLGRRVLLLSTCFSIACCFFLLGAYIDPRFRMIPWYTHRLWLYKKTKIISDDLLNITQTYNTISEQSVILNETDTKNFSEVTNNFTTVYTNENDSNILFNNVSLTSEANEFPLKESFVEETMKIPCDSFEIATPVLLMALILFLYNIGLGTVPYILITELFALNIRALATSFLTSWMWIINFIFLRYYGTVSFYFGLHVSFYILGSLVFLASWHIFLFLPETRGKSQQYLYDVLNGSCFVGLSKRRGLRKIDDDP